MSIQLEYWDIDSNLVTSLHPNYKELNRSITTKFLNIQKLILILEDDHEFSFEKLREELSDKPKIAVNPSFYDFSQKLIKEMIDVKRAGNAIVYQTAVNRLINYCGNKKIKVKDIDYNFLVSFKHQLLLEGAKTNTVGNYFRSIRAIYNKAIKAKIVERSTYPFFDISIKQERTAKRALSIDDIKRVANLPLNPKTPIWNAQNYFLLSFSLIGISFTDLAYLKPQNLVKGRISYKRRKTHKNYNIALTAFSQRILDLYKGSNSTYLLPILPPNLDEDSIEAKKQITQSLRIINKYLKRIGTSCDLENPLTSYVGRHTWATTAKRLGYSNELIAEAMGHEYGNKITNIYLDNFDQSVIDELNEKVINQL